MHISSFAPLLSAAANVDCIWIMLALSSFRRTGHDFDHAMVLGLRHRPALADAHQVTLAGAEVVVRVQLGRTAQQFAVQAVLLLAFHHHGDRLVHLVAEHAAFQRARGFRLFVHRTSLLLLVQRGLGARDLAARAHELVGLRVVALRLLHAQAELLAAQIDDVLAEFLRGLAAHLAHLHHSTARLANCVCTDSLAAARRNASRASASVTPSISYNMRPGCTGATQYSTLPLPAPMRTSIGFLVIGLSGNTRIHSLPPRLT